MPKYADYISKIEIKSLWSGHKHIVWHLQPGVNVLSGKNGAGKSTILDRMVQHISGLAPTGAIRAGARLGVEVDFSPSDADCIRYDIIRSFDSRTIVAERLGSLGDAAVATELDWQLYQLQRRYLDYQVNVGNRMIALLTNGDPAVRERAAEASEAKNLFWDLVDDLFSETGKHIDRESNELRFYQYDEPLSPYVLSSGEKQMLIILLTALTQDHLPYVLFMDEPEVSLHFDWQKRLISMVRRLNPNAQIILTTHSPAVIMDGWEDAVTEVSEITI
ncbi:ATP-binding protein [Alloprevotella sp. OH1205_COT-284]|uniref:AAA family ATPase n=1 Tax=Alloprevotella sp. OH1205_COT-284 TaxID=2491043 RepID=UPI000F5DB5FA|nr:ATP-binding protein [Alloprevotella sp. OH1205_COT-284]RRD79921.1 ATP-binding protein [Alloprevotella sp. OH1205_COT-284]